MTVATAAATFDTACTTFITALGVFQAAVVTSQASTVSATRPYGSTVLGAPGAAIMQKLVHYAAFQQLLKEAGLEGAIEKFSQGSIPGTAGPLTVLATVFAAV